MIYNLNLRWLIFGSTKSFIFYVLIASELVPILNLPRVSLFNFKFVPEVFAKLLVITEHWTVLRFWRGL